MDRRRAGLTAKATGLLFATLPVLALGLGLPALAGTLEQRRVVASLDRVSADFALARSSAILRREAVVVCPGAPATGCADGGDWSGGWLVFRDPDGNRRPDAPGDLLRVRAAPAAPDRARQSRTPGRECVLPRPPARGGGGGWPRPRAPGAAAARATVSPVPRHALTAGPQPLKCASPPE